MKKIVLVLVTFLLFLFSSMLTVNANETSSVIGQQWVSEITRNSATFNFTFSSPVKIQVRFVWKESGSEIWNETSWVTKEREGTHSEIINNLKPDTDYEFQAEIYEKTTSGEAVKFFTKIYIEIQASKNTKAGAETSICIKAEKGFVYVYENDNKGATMVTTQREFFLVIIPSPGQNKITVKIGRHTHSVEFYADE